MEKREQKFAPKFIPEAFVSQLRDEWACFVSSDQKWMLCFNETSDYNGIFPKVRGNYFLLSCYVSQTFDHLPSAPLLCFHPCWKASETLPSTRTAKEGLSLILIGEATLLPFFALKMPFARQNMVELESFQAFTGVPLHDAELRQALDALQKAPRFELRLDLEKHYLAFLMVRNLMLAQQELQNNRNRNGEGLCQMLIRFMEANLAGSPLSLKQLADYGGVSVSKLKNVFREQTSVSVYQFYLKLRMQYAFDLLKEGRLNVSEVAYHIGYNSVSKFSRKFQEHHGFLPSKIYNQKSLAAG